MIPLLNTLYTLFLVNENLGLVTSPQSVTIVKGTKRETEKYPKKSLFCFSFAGLSANQPFLRTRNIPGHIPLDIFKFPFSFLLALFLDGYQTGNSSPLRNGEPF